MASPDEKKVHLGNVLVVGGCGFLGHHTVRMLVEGYSCSVSVVDLRCTRNRRPDSDGVAYFEADITDKARLSAAFADARPDVVIHTASPAAQGEMAVAHELFRRVNVDGTAAVIEACRSSGVKALVFTSSASIMSDNDTSELINADERWPVIRGANQKEYYSETKAAAEEMVLAANEPGRLLTAAIRPAGILGEGDTMTILQTVRLYRQGRWNVQVGNNDNLFDFTYVENVVHGHLLAARALLATRESSTGPLDHERVDGEAFIITNDSPLYFWDNFRIGWRVCGMAHGLDKVWILPRGLGLAMGWASEMACWLIGKSPTFTRQRIVYSTMTRYYNISKAKRRLGYKPIVSLEEGIRRGVQAYLDQEKAALSEKA